MSFFIQSFFDFCVALLVKVCIMKTQRERSQSKEKGMRVKGYLNGRYCEGSGDGFLNLVRRECLYQAIEAKRMAENDHEGAEDFVEPIEFRGSVDGKSLEFTIDPWRDPSGMKERIDWLEEKVRYKHSPEALQCFNTLFGESFMSGDESK